MKKIDKLKWARQEIGKRLRNKNLSQSERSSVMKNVWDEANAKFSEK